MFKKLNKNKCIDETNGTIIKVWFNNNNSRRLTVEYFVNGQSYILKETVTVKSVAIKSGNTPIGQKKVEYITEGIGGVVAVKYNPDNPKQAYLRDNSGKYV